MAESNPARPYQHSSSSSGGDNIGEASSMTNYSPDVGRLHSSEENSGHAISSWSPTKVALFQPQPPHALRRLQSSSFISTQPALGSTLNGSGTKHSPTSAMGGLSIQSGPTESPRGLQLVDRTGRTTVSVTVVPRPEKLPDLALLRLATSFKDLPPIDEQQELTLRSRLQAHNLRNSQNSTKVGSEAYGHQVLTPLLYVGGIHGSLFYENYQGHPWVMKYHVLQIWHTSNHMEAWIHFETLKDCDHARIILHSLQPEANLNAKCIGFHGHKVIQCIGPKQFQQGTGRNPKPTSMTFGGGFLGMILMQVVFSSVNEYVPCALNDDETRRLEEVAIARLHDVFPSHVVRSFGSVPPSRGDDMPTKTFVVEFEFPAMADFWRQIDISSGMGPLQVMYKLWAMPFDCRLFEPNFNPSELRTEQGYRLREFRSRYWSHESIERRMTVPVESVSYPRQTTPVRQISDPMFGTPGQASSTSSSRPVNNRNAVDLERVQHGLDVRTTIMLRNIPNRMDHPSLKHLLDKVTPGRFDFLYLRIDFENGCNVGYAFVNFTDTGAVIEFIQNVRGRNWLNSDKIADCSYATIQGRETLIEKFRNSVVMAEPHASRPHLYYTIEHHLVGEEEPFPQPNNLQKFGRSCQNAQTDGLYSPARGRGRGSPGRRRRGGQYGQYDRGNSYARVERLQTAPFGMPLAQQWHMPNSHGYANTAHAGYGHHSSSEMRTDGAIFRSSSHGDAFRSADSTTFATGSTGYQHF